MKSLAHWSLPRITSLPRIAAVVSAAALGVCCQATAAAAASVSPALPDGGPGFMISLAASSPSAFVGQSVTLTATTNADVGPTPYYITIYSETTGAELAVCGFGTTCSATVSQNATGVQDFEAFVGDDVAGEGHPGFTLVSSNEVPVTWWFLYPKPRHFPGPMVHL
jgi:hypothetical protein